MYDVRPAIPIRHLTAAVWTLTSRCPDIREMDPDTHEMEPDTRKIVPDSPVMDSAPAICDWPLQMWTLRSCKERLK